MLKWKNEQFLEASCDQCGRSVFWQGAKASERFKAARERFGADLCEHCAKAARNKGVFRYSCEGCSDEVTGVLDEVRGQLDCFGKAFCSGCKVAFFGRFDPANRAMAAIVRRAADPPPRPRRKPTDAELRRSYELECAYSKEVRALSKKNLKAFPEIVNPQGRTIGRSGQPGACHLDHIVPVTVCFSAGVPVADAASPENLQVVPWRVNVSRNNHFDLHLLAGWPGLQSALAAYPA